MEKYKKVSNGSAESHFSQALFGEVEKSRMTAPPIHLTTMNAGDIVPIYCREVLPEEILSLDSEFVIRQTTLRTPTMGSMMIDLYAFFVPNRVVNKSFKAVMGENYNGSWTANKVSLAPLCTSYSNGGSAVQVPVGSVADYYGFPTQAKIPLSVLRRCHDLKFRGYVMIYNEFFRDQNYQPPIPMSTLNVYQGFFDSESTPVPLDGSQSLPVTSFPSGAVSDGSFPVGSVVNELYGGGSVSPGFTLPRKNAMNSFRALDKPLKANKLHDYFTSALPSPQKASEAVFAPVSGLINSIPVVTSSVDNPVGIFNGNSMRLKMPGNTWQSKLGTVNTLATGVSSVSSPVPTSDGTAELYVAPSNLVVAGNVPVTGLSMDISDLRMAAAIQQVYEALGRGGSRYREYLRSFFGLEVDDPFDDIPKRLGHIRRELELYQTAQTSASQEGSTAQGNLAAFGYTAQGGKLFENVKFLEHGYVHVMAVIRHKNIYSSYMARDNFRLSMLDFYQPQLANISEQPLYAYELNPFASQPLNAIGYQEAWAEYRYEPDMVSGYMRPGISESLAVWNYADDFDSGLQVIDDDFVRSNSEEVLNRTVVTTSEIAPQFKCAFKMKVDKELPMPTYSVPGMDII